MHCSPPLRAASRSHASSWLRGGNGNSRALAERSSRSRCSPTVRGAGMPSRSLVTLTASNTPSPRWNVTSQMLHFSDAAGVGTPLRDAKVLLRLLRLRSVRSAIIASIISCQTSEMVHNEGPRAQF